MIDTLELLTSEFYHEGKTVLCKIQLYCDMHPVLIDKSHGRQRWSMHYCNLAEADVYEVCTVELWHDNPWDIFTVSTELVLELL